MQHFILQTLVKESSNVRVLQFMSTNAENTIMVLGSKHTFDLFTYFCTQQRDKPVATSVACFDTTFKLGSFFVSYFTFKQTCFKNNPAMIGPGTLYFVLSNF